MYEITFKESAEKTLADLPRDIQKRISRALDELSEQGLIASNIKKLRDPESGFRKRVGDYRILFDIHGTAIHIRRIGKRAEAYR